MPLFKSITKIFGRKQIPAKHIILPSGQPPVIPTLPKDPSDSPESYENEMRDFESQRIALQLDQFKQDTKNQNRLFNFIIRISIGSLTFLALTVIAKGFNIWGFDISDNILMTSITGVLLKILGMLLVITWYLFPKNPEK